MTTTMRAAVLTAFGSPLEIQDVDVPTPAAGEVLVRVLAAGLNPLDTKIRGGQAAHARTTPPAVLGIDMAGVVAAVGAGVDDFAVGDEVFGMVGGVGGIPGTLAEFVAADARLLAPKPRALSMRQAAAVPLAFITAWEALVDRAQVHDNQRVLVHGGGGGVGYLAIQLARSLGAEVFATGSGPSGEAIAALNATFIDYRTTPVHEYVQTHTGEEGFDVVFDTVGGTTLDDSFAAVRTYTGHVVSALGWGTHSLAPLSFRGATYSGVFTLLPLLSGRLRERHGQALRSATALADAGRLAPRLDGRRFALDDTDAAYDIIENHTAAGKVVIEMSRSHD